MGMLQFLIRRLLLAIPTLFGITLVTFTIIRLAPGDPASVQTEGAIDKRGAEKRILEIRKRFHLDEPIYIQYGLWMRDLLTLNLGTSITDDRPVLDKIKAAFWPTVTVNAVATGLALLVSIPFGIACAARQNGVLDRGGGTILYMLYSIPSYVGAIVLILFVSVRWGWLPFRGMHSDNFESLSTFAQYKDTATHMVLYVVCAAYGVLAYYARFVRQNMLEVVRQDYIRTAKAKGLSESAVVIKHAFRNSLIPLVTLFGLTLPSLIGGSVILEVIFTWPGLGRLLVDSVFQRDYPVVMALSTATAVLVLAGTIMADLLYGIVDPRVRYE